MEVHSKMLSFDFQIILINIANTCHRRLPEAAMLLLSGEYLC